MDAPCLEMDLTASTVQEWAPWTMKMAQSCNLKPSMNQDVPAYMSFQLLSPEVQDWVVPKHTIGRCIAAELPQAAKVSRDAQRLMQILTVNFCSFVALYLSLGQGDNQA